MNSTWFFQAKKIFAAICPDEDFLPAVPNPEDIVWDDSTKKFQPAGGFIDDDNTAENPPLDAVESPNIDGDAARKADHQQIADQEPDRDEDGCTTTAAMANDPADPS